MATKKSKELSPEMQQPRARRYANESLEGMASTSIPRSGSRKPPLPGRTPLDFDLEVGDHRFSKKGQQ